MLDSLRIEDNGGFKRVDELAPVPRDPREDVVDVCEGGVHKTPQLPKTGPNIRSATAQLYYSIQLIAVPKCVAYPSVSFRRSNLHKSLALSIVIILLVPKTSLAKDPLPSWKEGETKSAIIAFVTRVTDPTSADFVPPAERIATFDNDGTLWSEQPIYFQLAFMLDRVEKLAEENPEWKERQPFKAAIEGDIEALAATGKKGLLELAMATHAGTTTDEFEAIVRDWIATARHPRFDRPYTECVFQPMLELLNYLRENEFKTWIVSGGGIEFMRPWAEKTYGIPPEQVIGNSIKTRMEMRDGKPVLVRLPELEFIDDKEEKPVGIHRFIGRRPIAAFGNSDGDLQMLQWTAAGTGARFCMIVHHTDANREWAYDRDSHIGRLDKALDEAQQRGWTVVDMKRDWKSIYAPVHHYLKKTKSDHAARWSYRGDSGPARWGDLSPDYVLAKTGREQSPIDLHSASSASLPELRFHYKPSKIHLIYNGHTVQENEDPGSFGSVGEKRLELQQFHFHSPSEHTVDGNHFPMEMHLVHKASDGTVGVVAVFIRQGEHNKAFDHVWNLLPDANEPKRDSELRIDTMALLPESRGYYSYHGSFTTPPCTEQVKWVVLKTPVELSKRQIERFRLVIDGNNRPVQPLNGRTTCRVMWDTPCHVGHPVSLLGLRLRRAADGGTEVSFRRRPWGKSDHARPVNVVGCQVIRSSRCPARGSGKMARSQAGAGVDCRSC